MMSFESSKHPRGQADNAGQFRDKANSEPEAPLPRADFDMQSHVLDHAGAYYDWFDDVRVHAPDGNLHITVADYAAADAGNTDPRQSRTKVFTADQVWTALRESVAESTANGFDHSDYEHAYLEDTLSGNFDDADGDANVIDSLLQKIVFGESVFG